MKIAVTAASGQLGGAIVQELKSHHPISDIVGLARTPSKAQHLDIEIRSADYADKSSYDHALKDVHTLLLVSGNVHPDERIIQHRNVIQAAVEGPAQKLVYVSVLGPETGSYFSPIVASNRQTEQDVKSSGLSWVIGRNGIYIEPDIEYLQQYLKAGKISNCAGEGKCAYTTRSELAFVYAKILTEDRHAGSTYNLTGEAITQSQLAEFLNQAFGTDLFYEDMSVEAYLQERSAALGEGMGAIITGIYQGIRQGAFDVKSHYLQAAGREHIKWKQYFQNLVE